MKKRVAIVTPLFDSDSSYNLVGIIEPQVRALQRNGYDPVVVVQKNFRGTGCWNPHQLDIRPVLPRVALAGVVDGRFQEDVAAIVDALAEPLAQVDVVLTHDLFYHEYFLRYNHACRRFAERDPRLLWLNWIHSPPHDIPKDADSFPANGMYTPPPGYLVYPNHGDVPKLAQMFRTEEHQVRVVRPAVDPCDVCSADDLTRRLYEACGFARSDLCIVYRARPNPEDQAEKVLRLAAEFQRSDLTVSLLFIDWYSTESPYKERIEGLKELATGLGFEGFFVASELDERCRGATPRNTTRQLLGLADLYVLPMAAGAYSYEAHEALLSGSLVILNGDLLPLPELFNGFARYLPFGAIGAVRRYLRTSPEGTAVEDEQSFWRVRALEILAEIRGNRVLFARSFARTQWNPDAVFLREVEPLFHLGATP